jgi:hypothetical protein
VSKFATDAMGVIATDVMGVIATDAMGVNTNLMLTTT